MLYRLVTDSRGVVGQELRVGPGKLYEIHGFHSNPCRHLLQNLGWPPKFYRSKHNFMLYRWMTDSRGLVREKLGFWPKDHIRYMIFIVIFEGIHFRIWVDLLNHIYRRRILWAKGWWHSEGVLWSKNYGFWPKHHIRYMVFIVILEDICLRIWVDLLSHIYRRRI